MSEMTIEAIRELLRPRHVIACREALAGQVRPLVEGYRVEVVADPAIPEGTVLVADMDWLSHHVIVGEDMRPSLAARRPPQHKPFAIISSA